MFLAGTAAVLLATPLVARAQAPATIPRVGFLEAISPSPGQPTLNAFRQGLRELGYSEGRTIVIEDLWAEEHPARFPDLVAELLRRKVEVLVVGSAPGARAAQQATRTLPIVFVGVADPIAQGIVPSLARPSGNATGVSYALAEGLAGKWVELRKADVTNTYLL